MYCTLHNIYIYIYIYIYAYGAVAQLGLDADLAAMARRHLTNDIGTPDPN